MTQTMQLCARNELAKAVRTVMMNCMTVFHVLRSLRIFIMSVTVF